MLSPPTKWLRLKENGKLKLRYKTPEPIFSHVPACRPTPSLVVKFGHICGVCLVAQLMQEWLPCIGTAEKLVAEARAMWGADDGTLTTREQELEVLFSQRDAAEWKCRLKCATVRHVAPPKSAKLGQVVRCGSRLRNELRLEDLETLDAAQESSHKEELGEEDTGPWDLEWSGAQGSHLDGSDDAVPRLQCSPEDRYGFGEDADLSTSDIGLNTLELRPAGLIAAERFWDISCCSEKQNEDNMNGGVAC